MLSNKTKYGLKAMLHLAEMEGQGGQFVAEIAERNKIPKKFLDAILLELKNSNLLFSKKGKGGGYRLAKSSKDISLGNIIRILEGPLALLPCASASAYQPCEDCPDPQACQIRLVIQQVRDATVDILDHTSLSDLVRKRIPAESYLFYDI